MLNMNHFVRVSNAKYNALTNKFTGEKGLQEALDYETFIFNAVLRYSETGDPIHLNRCVLAARTMNRIRLTTAMLKGISAHAWGSMRDGSFVKLKSGGVEFGGEANKGKLRKLRRMGEEGLAYMIGEHLEQFNAESKAKEHAFDPEAYAEVIARKLIKAGANIVAFEALISKKVAELRAKEAA